MGRRRKPEMMYAIDAKTGKQILVEAPPEIPKTKMDLQFVWYGMAVRLHAIGFSEDCFGVYSENRTNISYDSNMVNNGGFILPAPLWQQAFDWFIEKHNIHSAIERTESNGGHFKVTSISRYNVEKEKLYELDLGNIYCYTFHTLIDAREWCLNRMIKMIEDRNKLL